MFFKFRKIYFYRQGVAGLKRERAPTEPFPMQRLSAGKKGVQNTLYEGGVAGGVERPAHTWVALSPLGVCSAVLPLFFLLPTESETSPRYSDMF